MHLAHGDQLAACGTDHSCPPAVPLFASNAGSGAVITNNAAQLTSLNDDATLMNGNLLKETTLYAYPNPFNSTTTVEFTSMESGWATLRFYDHLGQQVALLYDGKVEQGIAQKVQIDRDGLSPGIYLCTLRTDDAVITRTIILSD